MGEITTLIRAASSGDERAFDRLFALLYDDLHRLAHARLKRGGEFHLTALSTQVAESIAAVDDTVRLGDALDRLLGTDPALAELVELKFFCGFSFAEIAAMRGVSERTVQRDWQKARLLLHGELSAE